VNIISEWMVEAANHTCGAFPPEVDEFAVSGLTPIPSDVVGPPRCAESGVQMECKLTTKNEIYNDDGAHTTTVIFGRVVRFHVARPLLKDGPRGASTPVVDTVGLQPVGRLGGDTWVKLGDHFDIPRPQV
jgi:flavin reductase (DIM6/NTAB) family NADH-FMN oxidoreductase RutF